MPIYLIFQTIQNRVRYLAMTICTSGSPRNLIEYLPSSFNSISTAISYQGNTRSIMFPSYCNNSNDVASFSLLSKFTLPHYVLAICPWSY